ncbi:MAG: hypothetical protein V2A53_04910 [bacterium]
MTKKELIKYWVGSSDKDFKTMENLVKSTDYLWALFIGHLVIEKLLNMNFTRSVQRSIQKQVLPR